MDLVRRHGRASVFHTVGWLAALRSTYGYEPVVFTTSSPSQELSNGVLFCRVRSWITGTRLVSLPFSDHCEPLCDSDTDFSFIIHYLQSCVEHQNLRYMELRPVSGSFGQSAETYGFSRSARFYLHTLNLKRELHQVLTSFNKDSVQRRIRRAERAGLVLKCGQSDNLLRDFYTLFVKTRRRHRLPPSPYRWFRNLIRYTGEAAELRVAYQANAPVAAILTLRCKEIVYYKYGCSDAEFNRFGAMPWLLWRAIASAKSSGAIQFDMGRTEEHNSSLLAFKNHWVPQPQLLVYWRFPEIASVDSPTGWKLELAKRMFSLMPGRLRMIAGNVIYRHLG